MKLEDYLKYRFGYCSVQKTGKCGGGCISQGETFQVTKEGNRKELIYVKGNTAAGAHKMFHGEFASLACIQKTGHVKVPTPIAVLEDPINLSGAMLVMENMDIHGLSTSSGELGKQLANLHMHNIELSKEGSAEFESRFGFEVETCCGSIPQGNKWDDCWTSFYVNKLQEQMDLLRDDEANTVWKGLKEIIPQFFIGLDVKPSLLHGDLWSGNAGTVDGKPVIFDAASFYGHHEYDLAIAGMFGGFGKDFYSAYHSIIPKASGFEDRHQLYKLFHHLNHWNHFGDSYRSSSISIMKKLINIKK